MLSNGLNFGPQWTHCLQTVREYFGISILSIVQMLYSDELHWEPGLKQPWYLPLWTEGGFMSLHEPVKQPKERVWEGSTCGYIIPSGQAWGLRDKRTQRAQPRLHKRLLLSIRFIKNGTFLQQTLPIIWNAVKKSWNTTRKCNKKGSCFPWESWTGSTLPLPHCC